MKKMNGKMIFMLFSIMWGRIQEQTTNFEHLVHKTWPRTCGRVVFKFCKKQMKSENHERPTSVCKHRMWQLVWNLLNFFIKASTYDILTSFMIFGLRLLFIEFKNNSTASLWSCFVNKMFKIGGLFLDTASHYTK